MGVALSINDRLLAAQLLLSIEPLPVRRKHHMQNHSSAVIRGEL